MKLQILRLMNMNILIIHEILISQCNSQPTCDRRMLHFIWKVPLLCSACQILNQSNKLKSRIILLTNNCEQICGYWPIRGGEGWWIKRSISLISEGIKLLFIYFVDKMLPRLIVSRETRTKYFSKYFKRISWNIYILWYFRWWIILLSTQLVVNVLTHNLI